MFLKRIIIFSTLFFFLGASSVFAEIKQKGSNYDNTGYGGNDQGAGAAQYQDYLNTEAARLGIKDSTSVDGKIGSDTQALEKAVLDAQNVESQNLQTTTVTPATTSAATVSEQSKTTGNNDSVKAPVQFNCTKGTLCSDTFMIPTSKFSPGGTGLNKPSSKDTIKGFMTTLIQKLMIALGSLALLIMVIGAGFMMFAMGKDDNLNKGKTIFKAGIIALVIALSSYFMVSFLSYILYS